jgi:hypothetical protein
MCKKALNAPPLKSWMAVPNAKAKAEALAKWPKGGAVVLKMLLAFKNYLL